MLVFDVKSSHLRQIGYDEKKRQLFILYHNGERYFYNGVPQKTFIGLLTAKSCGKYLWKNIRGVYDYYIG